MKFDINMKARLIFVAFLLGMGVAGFIWYWVSAGQYAIYQLDTREPVSGLLVDAPVELHGVEVGRVKSIRLVDPHSVRVLLSVDRTAPVTSASVATITSRGLATRGFTGYVYVSIEDTSTDSRPAVAPPGEAYPVIPTARSKAVTLDTAIDQVRENVQVMTDLLQSVLDKKTVVSLRQSADNLQQVTRTLADNSDKLNSILASTERASRRLGPLLESSQETVKTLQGASHRLEPLLESSQETVRTLQGASLRLEPLLESSQDTVKALQTQILPQTIKTLTDLESLSGSFTDMAAKINRDPSIVIRGSARPAPGPGERN